MDATSFTIIYCCLFIQYRAKHRVGAACEGSNRCAYQLLFMLINLPCPYKYQLEPACTDRSPSRGCLKPMSAACWRRAFASLAWCQSYLPNRSLSSAVPAGCSQRRKLLRRCSKSLRSRFLHQPSRFACLRPASPWSHIVRSGTRNLRFIRFVVQYGFKRRASGKWFFIKVRQAASSHERRF